MVNRLAASASPYLRQHADNPVDWREWGPEAFEEARARDVPIFLSIGYAACHWCHVMAHESFEDPAVAAILDQDFVSIKVDREERPDVDQIYMDVTVALTGHGGWPMSVWLTPDGHAFHAGTYYPPTERGGAPSFTQVLAAVTDAWTNRRAQLLEGGSRITAEVAARSRPPAPASLSRADVDQAVGSLVAQADDAFGGFGDAPKFPPSTTLDALVARAAQADGPIADQAWNVAADTLERMARGGIYDQLAGGFARYATDRAWVVPHFEKMLYDNALLIGCYARGAVEAQRRGDPLAALCERVVVETIEWLTTEMLTEQGAFASSLDADSIDPADGQLREGAYYVWTPDQLAEVVGEVDGDRLAHVLGVEQGGTFEHGTSTLQLRVDPDEPAWFADARQRLRAARSERPAPGRDDKVVAAWNGWAIASIVDAAMLLGRPEWLPVARRVATAVLEIQLDGDRLRRVSLGGVPSQAPGAAEDYAGTALGLLALAGATGEAPWLESALALLESLERHFLAEDGGLHDAADDAETLVRRPREVGENATPSGTTTALRAYRAAYRLTADDRWRVRAEALLATVATHVARAPRAAGWALADAVAEHGGRSPVEVAIVGEDASGELTRAAWRGAPPGSVVVTGAPDSGIPLLTSRPLQGGGGTAYVCRGHVCELPVTSVDGLQRLLA
ncbi:thioredoxin domain-containing protein [Pseudactinotalea suaedae]|uniref:thioredoxin domain-containing protein n=1 Tax=Pseudactinotalea suaedae TaxID=1524924 RepID=UPI0012E20376|nr:thioredoxin domain-containing protein [Pseudactinotalea suaedae]